MMVNDDNLANPEIKDNVTNKYKKNVNEILENAEIEAEIEAEKKIRSKNSRIFLISMFGFAFISIVYFQINKKTATPIHNLNAPVAAPINNAKVKLAKHTPVLNDENSILSTPQKKETTFFKVENQTIPTKELETLLIPNTKSKQNSKNIKKTIETKLIEKVTSSKPSKSKNSFFVQTGAFSLKKNANKLVKKLQIKGFNPSVNSISNGSKKFYLVQLGMYQNKEKAKEVQAKLARAGYSKTIIK